MYSKLITKARLAQLWDGPRRGGAVTMERVQFLADLLAEVTNALEVLDNGRTPTLSTEDLDGNCDTR